jgi:hypothetical protein
VVRAKLFVHLVLFPQARKERGETRPVICSAIVVGNQRFPLGSLSNIRLIERAFRVVRLVVRHGEVAVPGGDLHGN